MTVADLANLLGMRELPVPPGFQVWPEAEQNRLLSAFREQVGRAQSGAVTSAIDEALDFWRCAGGTLEFEHHGQLVHQGDDLWPLDDREVVVRLPQTERLNRRDIQYIPAPERQAALYRVLRDAVSVEPGELLSHVARLFGTNLNARARAALEQDLEHLLGAGAIATRDDGTVRVCDPDVVPPDARRRHRRRVAAGTLRFCSHLASTTLDVRWVWLDEEAS
jgi:hypothetical protein